jgi:uncharacterized protein YlxP (DUF503 family)
MQLDIKLYAVASLKDKRSVTRRLQADLQHRFAVSVAETDFQDFQNRLGLGIAAAGSSSRTLESLLQTIENHLAADPELEILNVSREILTV